MDLNRGPAELEGLVADAFDLEEPAPPGVDVLVPW